MTPVVLTRTPEDRTGMILVLLCRWCGARKDSHVLCPIPCYLIQLGYKRTHENLTYFLVCLGIYLWQSLKNLNCKLPLEPEFYWGHVDMTCI